MQADKTKVTKLLKTARGQLDGLIKMVEDDRYCIDISNQLMATQAILKKVNREILHEHLDQRTHHLLDLRGVILGDARVAHRVKEYVGDDGDRAVLAL